MPDETPILRRMGDYELLEEVARGGMGIVFRARQVSLDRIVAVKLMRDGSLARPSDVERFHTEAASAAKLRHPNIVAIHEVGEQGGQHFFAMDLIEGANLAERTREGPLPVREAAGLVATISDAVQHAHAIGVLHRDLKPSNILVNVAGEPFVTDFGLARPLDACGSLTVTGQLLGTPAYMAPEQARGVTLGPAADVYSLGAVLYHLLTGRSPFVGGNVTHVLNQVLSSEPLPPQLLNPSVPADLATICLKCLEKEPRHRYDSASDLAADLTRWLEGEPISARPSTAWERAAKWTRRKPAIAGLAATVIAVTSLGTAGIFWQWRAAVDARRVAEERAVAESNSRARGAQLQKDAEQGQSDLAKLLGRLEVQRAEELFRADKAAPALAHLARVLRENPTNTMIAERIIDALTQKSFALPTVSFLRPENYNAKFSPNSRWIAASSASSTVVVDSSTGQPIGPGITHNNRSEPGGQILFSPDSRWVAVWYGNTVDIIESQTGRPSALSPTPTNYLGFVHFSPDSRLLVTGSGTMIRHWDCASGKETGPILRSPNPQENFTTSELTPDGRWEVTIGRAEPGKWFARVWDVATGLNRFEPIRFSTSVKSGGFGTEGNIVRLVSGTGVVLWNCQSGVASPLGLDETKASGFTPIALSPDGGRLLSKPDDSSNSIRVTHIPSGRLVTTLPIRWAGSSTGQFSPDGSRVLILSPSGTMQIWDATTGRLLGEITHPPAEVKSAQFSGNGEWIIATYAYDNAMMRIWDGHTGLPVTEPIRFDRQWGQLGSAELSPDGRQILVKCPAKTPANPFASRLVLLDIRWGSPMGELFNSNFSRREATVPPEWVPTSRIPSIAHSPIPAWLPEMAEVVAGQRFNDQLELESIPLLPRLQLKERILGTNDGTPYQRWAEWFFAPTETRPISPFSPLTVPEYIGHCIEQNSLAGYYGALRVAPTNGVLLAHLARGILNQNPAEDLQFEGDADSYSRRAMELAPGEPITWSVRAEVLFAAGKQAEARRTLEEAIRRLPTDPDLWDQIAALWEGQGQVAEAEMGYSKAISLSAASPGWPQNKRVNYLAHRADLLRQQNRSQDADTDLNAALAMDRHPRRNDWPSWGGPDLGRNMYSAALGLPRSFDPGRVRPFTEDIDMTTTRNVKWVAKLGSQTYGNPTVADGKVFVGTNNESPRHSKHRGDRSILLCLDEQNGGLLWQLVIPKLKSGKVNDWEMLGLLSSPAVEGNRLYLASTRGEALCLTTEGLAGRNVGPFKDEARYSAGPDSPLGPIGRRDADIVWKYDMIEDLSVFPHNGTFTSPLIIGDLIFLNTCNGMDWTHINIPSPYSPSLIALNKRTGKLAGEDNAGISQRIYHSQWGSPSAGVVQGRTLVFHGGGDGFCYAFDSQPVQIGDQQVLKKVWSIDCNPPEYRVKNGKPIKYPAAEGPSEIIATPVFWKNRVFVPIGQDPEHGEGVGNLVCLDPSPELAPTQNRILWSFRGIKRSISSPSITPDGLLFIGDFSGFVYCLDADTGAVHWVHDMGAHLWGSTMVADGKVFLGDEDGDFVILAATREKRVLSRMMIDGQEEDGPNLGAPIYSTPIVANGVLYVATSTHLYAIHDAARGNSLPMQAKARSQASRDDTPSAPK